MAPFFQVLDQRKADRTKEAEALYKQRKNVIRNEYDAIKHQANTEFVVCTCVTTPSCHCNRDPLTLNTLQNRQKGRIWKRNFWRISISSYSNWNMREKPYCEGWRHHVSNSSEPMMHQDTNNKCEYYAQPAIVTQPSLAGPPWKDRNSSNNSSTSPAIRRLFRYLRVYPKLLHARTSTWSRYYIRGWGHCFSTRSHVFPFSTFKEQVSEDTIISPSDFFEFFLSITHTWLTNVTFSFQHFPAWTTMRHDDALLYDDDWCPITIPVFLQHTTTII